MHHAIAWYDRLPRNSIQYFDDMMRKFLSKYFPPSMVTKLRNEITKFEQKSHESLFEAWEHYKLSIDRCPNYNMLLVTQIDMLYNCLTLSHWDTINVVAGGTFMQKTPEECYELIENMTAHHNHWDTFAFEMKHLEISLLLLLPRTLHAYFAVEGIQHQMSVARTPEQNGVVERWNRTLVEAARTMLSTAKVPLFFWAEAIATACFTQNLSLVIPRQEKTPYHIINDRKPSVKFFHIFGSVCYIVRDGENLDKMKEKDQNNSDPAPECQTMASDQLSSDPAHEYRTVQTSNELDLLFSLMFDELLNGSSKVVSKSSAVSAPDAPNQRQQHTTPLNNHTTPAPTYDEFINIFSTLVQDQGETSSRHVDSSNMHTFYQRFPFEHRWTKDHPLEQVIGNPSQSVRTRRQLESDAEMCIFALTVSRTEPKNIKEAMEDSTWIESMQEELHQFDRLDVWEL
nr:retrovirus-related Pol polyprotein from transposon TNT 1-94 [Tanacetum cinerariifolium]